MWLFGFLYSKKPVGMFDFWTLRVAPFIFSWPGVVINMMMRQ